MKLLFSPGDPKYAEYTGGVDLKSLQAAVGGGLIQMLDIQYKTTESAKEKNPAKRTVPAQLIFNEEGKLKRMPLNTAATAVWHAYCRLAFGRVPDDVLVGPVLLFTGPDLLE